MNIFGVFSGSVASAPRALVSCRGRGLASHGVACCFCLGVSVEHRSFWLAPCFFVAVHPFGINVFGCVFSGTVASEPRALVSWRGRGLASHSMACCFLSGRLGRAPFLLIGSVP